MRWKDLATIMTSRMLASVQRYKTDLTAHETQAAQSLTASYQKALAALQPQLEALYQQMTDALASGDTLSLAWLYQAQRLETLQKFIVAQMNQYGSFSQVTVQQLQAVGAALGQQAGAAQLSLISTSFAQASPGAIAGIVGATQAGSPLATLFNGFGADAAQGAAQALKLGITLGYPVQKVAKDIQAALDVERSRALTIARTELLRAYRGANLETYRANPDLTQYWQWICDHSDRTCAACLAMDGSIHPMDEEMDTHVNCRCTMAAVPSDPAFQSDYQSGSDWLDEQDVETQQQILGNKYDGWANGDFTLADIVGRSYDGTWGGSIYVKSLKQLTV